MSGGDVRTRIVERVRALCAAHHEPVVAIGQLRADSSLGERAAVEDELRALILLGDLRAIRAGGGIFVAPGTDREKRRRAALAALTERVLADMGSGADRVEALVDAMKIVDAIEDPRRSS